MNFKSKRRGGGGKKHRSPKGMKRGGKQFMGKGKVRYVILGKGKIGEKPSPPVKGKKRFKGGCDRGSSAKPGKGKKGSTPKV